MHRVILFNHLQAFFAVRGAYCAPAAADEAITEAARGVARLGTQVAVAVAPPVGVLALAVVVVLAPVVVKQRSSRIGV